MKVFDKIRDLFTEEVEEEEKEEPVKKEVIQVEIPAPEVKKEVVVEEEIKPAKQPEEKNNYPVFFDEKDFEDIERKERKEEVVEPKKEQVKETYKEAYKEPYKESYRDPYSYKKEEKKHFSPTPIISPVYGVLDKNYKKDDIVDKPKKSFSKSADMTIDDVRNKAYGTLEDELESTLFGKTSILFATKEEKSYDELENELNDAAASLDLLREDPKQIDKVKTKKENKVKEEDNTINETIDYLDPTIDEDDNEEISDSMMDDLLGDDNMVESVLGQDLPEDENFSENDLFNLIDNMYEKGDK